MLQIVFYNSIFITVLYCEIYISCIVYKTVYRISSYSFRGNYSFLDLETQRSQYIRPKVTVHKCAETIQGRKLIKGRNYMRKYGKQLLVKLSKL